MFVHNQLFRSLQRTSAQIPVEFSKEKREIRAIKQWWPWVWWTWPGNQMSDASAGRDVNNTSSADHWSTNQLLPPHLPCSRLNGPHQFSCCCCSHHTNIYFFYYNDLIFTIFSIRRAFDLDKITISSCFSFPKPLHYFIRFSFFLLWP